MNPSKKSNAPVFNVERHLEELNDRFRRFIKMLGDNNSKGTDRYDFEVDFAYATHELRMCPTYMQGKMFDKASSVVNNLVNYVRNKEPDE